MRRRPSSATIVLPVYQKIASKQARTPVSKHSVSIQFTLSMDKLDIFSSSDSNSHCRVTDSTFFLATTATIRTTSRRCTKEDGGIRVVHDME
jgi:hypothetical protein